MDDVDPEIEVVAEPTLLHGRLQIAVRRRHQTYVTRDLLVGPHRAHAPFLQGAQQLGLERERKLSDLVEEQGAAIGLLEEPRPGPAGIGEGALDVPEELTLEERTATKASAARRPPR